MQVGNEAKRAHQDSHGDGQREVDDGEAYAEQYAYADGNDELAAEVSVHAVLVWLFLTVTSSCPTAL